MEGPIDPTSQLLCASRVRRGGPSTFWAVRSCGERFELRKWQRPVDGEGWYPVGPPSEHRSLDQASGYGSDLLSLKADEITEYWVDCSALQMRELVQRLVCDGTGNASDLDWGVRDVERWRRETEEMWIIAEDDRVDRWASINDRRVVVLRASNPSCLGLLPVLAVADEIVGDEVADFSWSSECSPASSAGSTRLLRVADRVAVSVALGDDAGQGIAALPYPFDPQGQIEMISNWLELVEDYTPGPFHAAALALEPLDPHHTLTDPERVQWQEAIHGQEFGFKTSLMPDAAKALRSRLAETDGRYAAIAEGLADPHSSVGRQLFLALTEGEVRIDI